jgi:hypothetical protein
MTSADPLARPWVDYAVPVTHGSVRLHSASGGLESLWIDLRDEDGAEVVYDRATGQHTQPAVRVTPREARALAEALLRYARTHRDTEDQ